MEEKKNFDFWVEKICKSKVFTSPSDTRLLRYLVDSSVNGRTLKETIIAIDIFNRDPSFNPGDDSIVRSSIYNLRKKIGIYYHDEGESDEIRIAIPKGSYQVVFEELKKNDELMSTVTSFLKARILWLIIVVLAIVTVLFVLLFFFQRQDNIELKKPGDSSFFWSDMAESEKPLLIVLGDYFMMERIQPVDSSHSFIRNPDINTPEDFISYRDKNPEIKDQMKAFGMSYFGEDIPWGLMKIFEVFKRTSKRIDIKYSSKLTTNDLRNNDLIFFGDFSTLTILKSFLYRTHYRFMLNPPTIYYCENYVDTTEVVSISNRNETDFQNDYTLVAKINGHEGNRIILFLSFSPFGKTEAIYKLTDPSFQNEIEKFSMEKPEYWDLFLKVSGLGTSGFYYEILRFEALTPRP